jgi:hypothetical protein
VSRDRRGRRRTSRAGIGVRSNGGRSGSSVSTSRSRRRPGEVRVWDGRKWRDAPTVEERAQVVIVPEEGVNPCSTSTEVPSARRCGRPTPPPGARPLEEHDPKPRAPSSVAARRPARPAPTTATSRHLRGGRRRGVHTFTAGDSRRPRAHDAANGVAGDAAPGRSRPLEGVTFGTTSAARKRSLDQDAEPQVSW